MMYLCANIISEPKLCRLWVFSFLYRKKINLVYLKRTKSESWIYETNAENYRIKLISGSRCYFDNNYKFNSLKRELLEKPLIAPV